MRRGAVFAVLTIPAALWTGVVLWAQWNASGWTPELGELRLSVRVALASSHWVVRGLPFAVLPVALVWPLIIAGITALVDRGASPNSPTRCDVVIWWCVSAVAFAGDIVAGGIFYLLWPKAEIAAPALAFLAWVGIVAFWMSMAAAYSVQRKRYAAQQSPWHPRKALVALLALNVVGIYALPMLVAIVFRKDASLGEAAVERKVVLPESPSKTLNDR
ncbi:MAG: hypothetical protein JXO72_13120 [Vicinamibacteria bacterium]|nr:hypothetical protein [Vicinamibacteria bacterium]